VGDIHELFRWWWLFSRPVVSNSLQPHGLQHARGHAVPQHLLRFAQVHVHCIGDAVFRYICVEMTSGIIKVCLTYREAKAVSVFLLTCVPCPYGSAEAY